MPDLPDTDNPPRWHLDRKVPIAIIGSVVMQTSVIIWWASGVEHRIQTFDQKIIELGLTNKAQDVRTDAVEAERRINLQRLSRVEQAMSDIRDLMSKVDAKLDRLSERR